MESNDGQPSLKRLRATTTSDVQVSAGDNEQGKPAAASTTSKEEGPPPYGSQRYWEERYRSQFELVESVEKKEAISQQDTLPYDGKTQEDCPDPFHAWYFNYEELAPILLPLILGDNVDATQDENDGNASDLDAEEKDEAVGIDIDAIAGCAQNEATIRDETTKVEVETAKEEHNGTSSILEDGDNEKDWGDFEEVGSEEDEEEEAPSRTGLAKDGPIAVLEVGCGDVPLGRDLALGIENLPINEISDFREKGRDSREGSNVSDPTLIIRKVVCMDYSSSVIRAMKAQQTHSDGTSDHLSRKLTIPIEYEVADARDLPYPDGSYQLILEKGTLDAMLSDREKGSNNCITIVKEMSRVLSIGGAIFVISHLNAHVTSGMKWLDDILIPGLRQGGGSCEWEVEIHGNGDEREVGHNENQNASKDRDDGSSASSQEEDSPGPAVYIAHKRPPLLATSSQTDSVADSGKNQAERQGKNANEDKPPVPLRFFTY